MVIYSTNPQEVLKFRTIPIFIGVEKIDMNRLRNILERNILEYLSNLESSPHDAISFLVIGDVLYGNTPEDVSSN